jgi:hypothetical protein
MAVLADASEITGLPRDSFEIHEISKEEFENGTRIPSRKLVLGDAILKNNGNASRTV